MKTALAIEYLHQRMTEQGFHHYETHVRQFVVKGNEEIKIDGGGDVWVLCEETMFFSEVHGELPAKGMRIESDNGVYDLTDENIPELEHEHTGEIRITNHVAVLLHVMFLQGTPKNCEV